LLDAGNEVIYETRPPDTVLRHNGVLLGLCEAAINCAQRGSPTELGIARHITQHEAEWTGSGQSGDAASA